MALIFQYGSNMSVARLNSKDRLDGCAKKIGIVKTIEKFDFEFSVWSNNNKCAAANIKSEGEEYIWGVLYEVEDSRVFRDLSKEGEKCLDQVEGEGSNYERIKIKVFDESGNPIKEDVYTYVVRGVRRQDNLKTNKQYISHILNGLKSNNIPKDYIDYVMNQIKKNNTEIFKNEEY